MKRLFTFSLLLLAVLASQAQDSLKMEVLYQWNDTNLVPSAAFANTYNEVWGFERNGREYGVIGTTEGTHIFDVTNPAQSQQVQFIPGTFAGPNVIHRDYHDYGQYLYIVCDEGPSALQIAVLSPLPDSAPIVYESDSLFERSHNIFIDESSGLMYVSESERHLLVVSLANPVQPEILLECRTEVPWWDATVGYVHDMYVRNDTAYLNAGNEGLFIVDFSNPVNPVLIGSMDIYPQQGYNHSGWLHDNGYTYAFADETHGMDIKVCDVSDMNNITIESFLSSGVNDSLSIPHNLIFKGDFLYVSYYYDGVYVFWLHEPDNPVLIGYYDTSIIPHNGSFEGSWGVYPLLPSGNLLVSDMQNGLYVLDVSQVTSNGPELETTEKPGVFPNPFTDRIRVWLPRTGSENGIFELRDITGRLVRSATLNQQMNVLTVNDLPGGTYLYRVLSNGQVHTGKLIHH